MNELDIEPSKENQDIFFNKYSGIGKLGLDFANDDLEEALLTTFMKLSDCNLSARILTVFRHHNIKYISDLMRYTEWDLINMKNFGKISLMNLRAFLDSHGLSLERYEFDV
jgi:DNA-directed RNA polymerase subunit alpha